MSTLPPGSTVSFLAVDVDEAEPAWRSQGTDTGEEFFWDLRSSHPADDYLSIDDSWERLCQCYLPRSDSVSTGQRLIASSLIGVQLLGHTSSSTLSWISPAIVSGIVTQLSTLNEEEHNLIYEARYEHPSHGETTSFARETWEALTELALFYGRANVMELGVLVLMQHSRSLTTDHDSLHDFLFASHFQRPPRTH